jgi:hypothetical protein
MLKEKLRKILDEFIRTQNNNVSLFAILKMDDLIDKWSIIVSATWFTTENIRKIFDDFLVLLQNNLTNEELNTIARLNIMTIDEHLISELLNYKTGTDIVNQKINGNQIYEGYIIFSESEKV